MTQSKQRTVGSVLGYVYVGIQSIISLIYIPILIHGIGDSGYGLYQLIASVIAYFAMMEAPMSAAIVRFYSEYLERKEYIKAENVLGIGKRINFILSVLLAGVSVPCFFVIRYVYNQSLTPAELKEASAMFGIMIINVIVLLNNYVYIAALTAKEKYVFIKGLAIVVQVLQPVCVCLVIEEYPYALMVVLIQVVLNIVASIIRKYYAIKKINIVLKCHYFDKSLIKRMLGLSLSVLMVALADQIFWKSGQLIIGQQFGTKATAIYSVGAQLNSMFIAVGCVVSGVVLPTVTRIVNSDKSNYTVSLFWTKTGRIQAFIVCLVMSGVCLFGKEFIILLSGATYGEAYYVALLLMLPYTVDLVQNCALPIMQVKDCYKIRAVVLICMAVVNLILAILVVNDYGIVGVSAATGITVILGSGIVMNWVYKKYVGLDVKMFWKNTAPIFVITVVTAVIGNQINKIQISNSYFQFALHIILYVVLYLVMIYAVAFNDDEKEIVKRILKKM